MRCTRSLFSGFLHIDKGFRRCNQHSSAARAPAGQLIDRCYHAPKAHLLVVDAGCSLQHEVGVSCVRKDAHHVEAHAGRLFQRGSHQRSAFFAACIVARSVHWISLIWRSLQLQTRPRPHHTRDSLAGVQTLASCWGALAAIAYLVSCVRVQRRAHLTPDGAR